MTALVIAMAVLAAGVGLALAGPLLRRNAVPEARAEYDLTVFRDQLQEIERDAAQGLLDAEAAEAARLED
ncbi:MAG TPA: c-type cytochrome biogenesis protein CcmI, partial [Rhodospirillaceae bacterium]|nr:c-type cytochrome biogenesis protein CcmI [Rhodospirillaceae bacterium]